MSLTVTVSNNISTSFKKTIQGVQGSFAPQVNFADSLADGVAIDQADVMWHHIGRTLAASTTEDLDLSGGLTDVFGDAATFAKLKGIVINNKNTAAGDIMRIGGDANSVPLFGATNDYLNLGPGGHFQWFDPSLAGIAVTAGTGDILQIENTSGSNTLTYDILLFGTSA